MTSYGQFCPVAKAAEIFAERWTPLVLRELLCGSHRFNDLHRGVPLISRSLLTQRLRQLEGAGIVERRPAAHGGGSEYYLTAAGEEFRSVVMKLGEWGQRWTRRFESIDLDPNLLLWDMQRWLNLKRFPPRRVVIRYEFRGVPRIHRTRGRWWLVVEPDAGDVCIKDPGFEVDLLVAADLGAMTKLWLGDLGFRSALRDGLIALEGSREVCEAFPTWLALSPFATVDRPSESPAPQAAATHAEPS
jgi:DNA-binding HxlR family transcriptional regulator